MTATIRYLLDANVFIEAARRYYAFDLGTKFWDVLEDFAGKGVLQSIDRVEAELKKGKDDLTRWAASRFGAAFVSTNEHVVIQKYGEVMGWVQSSAQFLDYAKANFADGADGWLVAYAKVHKCKVVTHESFNPEIKSKVPIPNICRNFSVSCVDTFQMLRELEVKLS